MYSTLKEALQTYCNYAHRLPLVIAYEDEVATMVANKAYHGTEQDVQDSTYTTVHEEIAQCARCKSPQKIAIQSRLSEAAIMIVLNPPALISSVEKKVLHPQIDTMLQRMMKAIDVKMENCYITHMIKCESQKELPGTMFLQCQQFLVKEINHVKPRVIIVMGEILPMRKIIKSMDAVQWFGIEHPITLIKNPELKKDAWKTLKLVRATLDGE